MIELKPTSLSTVSQFLAYYFVGFLVGMIFLSINIVLRDAHSDARNAFPSVDVLSGDTETDIQFVVIREDVTLGQ